jgi:hypothetical protein
MAGVSSRHRQPLSKRERFSANFEQSCFHPKRPCHARPAHRRPLIDARPRSARRCRGSCCCRLLRGSVCGQSSLDRPWPAWRENAVSLSTFREGPLVGSSRVGPGNASLSMGPTRDTIAPYSLCRPIPPFKQTTLLARTRYWSLVAMTSPLMWSGFVRRASITPSRKIPLMSLLLTELGAGVGGVVRPPGPEGRRSQNNAPPADASLPFTASKAGAALGFDDYFFSPI